MVVVPFSLSLYLFVVVIVCFVDSNCSICLCFSSNKHYYWMILFPEKISRVTGLIAEAILLLFFVSNAVKRAENT